MIPTEEALEGGRLGTALLQCHTPAEADRLALNATRNELHIAAVMLTLACQTITRMYGGNIAQVAQHLARHDHEIR